MSTDLITVFRQKIFSLVDQVNPASKYKAVIVDERVSRIFSRVLETHELLDRNVSSVQLIDAPRQAETFLEAVYFIEPTRYSIECLAADFTRAPPRYACAHVFCLPGLTDELALKVRNTAVGRFLRRLEVVHIDLWPLESQVYSLDSRDSFEVYYNASCHDLVTRHIRHVASQIVGLCAVLGEYPVIRFHKPPNPLYEAHVLPYMLAQEVQTQLDEYARTHSEFSGISEARGRAQLLILDRHVDPYAPILHEFTFQAMAYDLLPITDGKKYTYKAQRGPGQVGEEEVEGIISEKDLDWLGLRHQHMQEVIEALTSKMDRLKKDNPHFADSATSTTVSDLQNMVASLPSFMETRDRFSLNLQMASECMSIMEKRALSELADIEQTVTLGVSADGRKSKSLAGEVVAMLADPRLSRADRVRLILIYALHRRGLVEADYNKLVQHCGDLNETDISTIRGMGVFGHPTVKDSLKEKLDKKTLPKVYFEHSTEDVYSISRFVPGIKNIAEQLIKGVLDSTVFPYTKFEPEVDETEAGSQLASLRNPRQRAVWAKTTPQNNSKQRVIVFVAGGITQSEARSVYELSKKYPKEFIIGGDSIITPASFLHSLYRLNVPRKQLNLVADRPAKRVPEHLFKSDRENKPQPAIPAAQPKGGLSKPSPVVSTTVDGAEKKKKSKLGRFFK